VKIDEKLALMHVKKNAIANELKAGFYHPAAVAPIGAVRAVGFR